MAGDGFHEAMAASLGAPLVGTFQPQVNRLWCTKTDPLAHVEALLALAAALKPSPDLPSDEWNDVMDAIERYATALRSAYA